ncbi:MAG TPA: AAA family ATPase [Humisphaera sp.]|jgi:predicted ATPase|nr:AAA family ATPase [Humisphaera sp.]
MIKRLSVVNFKSLRDVAVEFDPLTVLIGKSGAGKSNVVDALRFLRRYLASRSDNFVGQGEGWARLMCETASQRDIAFSVDFSLPGAESDFSYWLKFGPPTLFRTNLARPIPGRDYQMTLREEKLSFGSRPLYHQQDGQWIKPPDVAQPPSPGQLALGVVYGISEAQLAYQFLTRGIGCYDFSSDVLRPRNSKNTPADAGSSGLQDDGSNYLQVFERIAENISDASPLREIMSGLRKLNPSVHTLESEISGQDLVVGHRVADLPAMSLSLAQQSEGFRRFLAHLLALYQIPGKQTLIFEEPEKGIYPKAFDTLGSYLNRAAGRSAQIIMTTHNPLLLDHFNVDNIRVVEMPQLETRIGRVATDQLKSVREDLMTSGELLTVDEARTDATAELRAAAAS